MDSHENCEMSESRPSLSTCETLNFFTTANFAYHSPSNSSFLSRRFGFRPRKSRRDGPFKPRKQKTLSCLGNGGAEPAAEEFECQTSLPRQYQTIQRDLFIDSTGSSESEVDPVSGRRSRSLEVRPVTSDPYHHEPVT